MNHRADTPRCRLCGQPVEGDAVQDKAPPEGMVQSYLHPDCAAAENVRLMAAEARARERLALAGPKLLRACEDSLAFLEQPASNGESLERRLGGMGGFYVARLLRDAVAAATGEG